MVIVSVSGVEELATKTVASMHLPTDISEFRSGTGFVAPTKVSQICVHKGMRVLLDIASFNFQIRDLCFGNREEMVPSHRLRGLTWILCKMRQSFGETADITSFRQSVLGIICPGIHGVSWHPAAHGDVPGWVCMPDTRHEQGTSVPKEDVGHAVGSRCHIIFVHGGGLCSGDASSHCGIVTHLAKKCGRAVHVPHYRLCPESSKDDAVADVANYISGVCDKARSCVVIADSGGCYAAHHALARHPAVAKNVAHAIFMSPMLGLTALDSQLEEDAVSTAQLRWCYKMAKISPPEPTGLPGHDGDVGDGRISGYSYASTVTIFAAAGEILCNDAVQLADTLKSMTVPTKLYIDAHQVHAWPLMQGLDIPEMETSFDNLVDLILEADRNVVGD
eukprot:TRINITY_DN21268_c1_g2_i1.p1 TRINITY_DN21268_c1_g2~~TRINITY_DN21268_c1_g2_i1.p1  ORF type:complete len:391 (-),score=55.98 TRINITY_DN21268_c1_g2_i1:17-1189(-)